MSEAAVIGHFERRLAELGCPEGLARRKARELAEHHADLKEAALEEGCSEAEAGRRADAQLGEGASLAEDLAWVLRQASWWGRHPVIGYCLLPPIGFLPLWLLCAWLLVGAVWLTGHLLGPGYQVSMDTIRTLAQEPDEFLKYSRPLTALPGIGASVMMAWLFCWLAGRSVCGLKWMMTACAACSFAAAFSWVNLAPLPGQEHSLNLTLGYSSSPNWMCGCIPWLIAVAAFLQYRRRLRRLPALPRGAGLRGPSPWASAGRPGRPWLQSILTTPTYWIVTFLLALIIMGGLAARREVLRERAHPHPAEE